MSSILKLETTSGILEGHQAYAGYLEQTVADLLLHPANLNQAAQEELLFDVEPVFTIADNEKLLKLPSKQDVLDTLTASNQHAAPGTDGLTSFFYKQCFNICGGGCLLWRKTNTLPKNQQDGVWLQAKEGHIQQAW